MRRTNKASRNASPIPPASDDLPPQIWARTNDGDGYKPLAIDKFLLVRANSRRPPKLIRDLPVAKNFVRRAMEVAYWQVWQARRELPGPISTDFDRLLVKSEKAATALSDLIDHLQPGARQARDFVTFDFNRAVGPSEWLSKRIPPSSRERRFDLMGSAGDHIAPKKSGVQ